MTYKEFFDMWHAFMMYAITSDLDEAYTRGDQMDVIYLDDDTHRQWMLWQKLWSAARLSLLKDAA